MTEMKLLEIKKTYVAKCIGKFPESAACHEPIGPSHKVAINLVKPDGKEASTLFELITYDAETDTSIVKCHPITGRTHQIRVHLQYLGYPIENDYLYNSVEWGSSRGKGGIPRDLQYQTVQNVTEKVLGNVEEQSEQDMDNEHLCCYCTKERKEAEMHIFLHSKRYESDKWEYETEMPEWALPSSSINSNL